jgi:hypothetical protein
MRAKQEADKQELMDLCQDTHSIKARTACLVDAWDQANHLGDVVSHHYAAAAVRVVCVWGGGGAGGGAETGDHLRDVVRHPGAPQQPLL